MIKQVGLSFAMIGCGLLGATPAWGGVSDGYGGSNFELAFDVRGLLPEKTEHWDSAGGIELQSIFWSSEYTAVAFSFGAQGWSAEEEMYVEVDEDSVLSYYSEGRASAVPLGVSLLLRLPVSEQVGLTVEGGLRYLYIDSDVEIDVYLEEVSGTSHVNDVVEIDDTFLGVLGVKLDVPVSDFAWIYFGMGYQFDLGEPDEAVFGDYLDTTSFDAGYVSLGMSVLL